MFQQTITLFNRYEHGWIATRIDGCHVEKDKGALSKKYGPESKTQCEIYIHEAGNYMPFRKWREALSYYKNAGYTITPGVDLVLIGEFDGEVIDDADYPLGFHQYLLSEYDDAYLITGFSGVYGVIPHIEISGSGE